VALVRERRGCPARVLGDGQAEAAGEGAVWLGGNGLARLLIQDVRQFAGVELGPGTLYGALDRLERLGLIEPLPADERRHPYRITAPGAAALRVHLDSLERVSAAGRLRLQLGGT
jgi:hypothetical protein